MKTDVNALEYINFPHKQLPFGVTRRQFFKSMLTEVEVRSGTREGGEGCKLAELGLWTDAQISRVVPVVNPGMKIMVKNDFVFGIQPGGEEKKLFKITSTACRIFNEFDGMSNIGDIAEALTFSVGWDRQYCLSYVRGVFLTMVLDGICCPRLMN